MENKIKDSVFLPIAQKIENNLKEFADLYDQTKDRSALLSITLIDTGHTQAFVSAGVVGNARNIGEALYNLMKNDEKIAALVLFAANQFVKDKIENQVPDILGKIFETLEDNCNCPGCQERRRRTSRGN